MTQTDDAQVPTIKALVGITELLREESKDTSPMTNPKRQIGVERILHVLYPYEHPSPDINHKCTNIEEACDIRGTRRWYRRTKHFLARDIRPSYYRIPK